MSRLALGIAYDGRPWQGWQKQPNGQTVQDALERALAAFATVPVQTTCAGRTDTAVPHWVKWCILIARLVAQKSRG